jgi:uncharacterized surface protein with fasciclin (FAS1) repeats
MKQIAKACFIAGLTVIMGCSQTSETTATDETPVTETTPPTGQSGVADDVSAPNVVQIAAGSKDHSTLVTAVKTAALVDALSNAGPFTVFAPTNAAFDKLPAGTVEGLLTPEKRDALTDILQYHVYVGVIKTEYMQDGQTLNQVNGGNVKIAMENGQPLINGKAHIIASIPASNGIIHVIDEVLLPQ